MNDQYTATDKFLPCWITIGLLCGHLCWQQYIAPAQVNTAVDKAIKETCNA